MIRRLWIRADGSAQLGLGHVMRSVALAQAARRRGADAAFVTVADPVASDLPRRFGFPAMELQDADDRSWIAAVEPEDAVFFDGYHFDSKVLVAASTATRSAALMTDLRRGEFPVPLVVNQNPATKLDYELPRHGQLLVGPRYVLIREEFAPYRCDGVRSARRALLVLGGSDVKRLSSSFARRIAALRPDLELTVLLGPAAPELETLDDADAVVVRDAPVVAELFAAADLAVSAAGSTTWELLYLGIPTALVEVADNQVDVGRGVANSGAGIFLGESETALRDLPRALDQLSDPAKREQFHQRALELIDGQGADRILDALISLRG